MALPDSINTTYGIGSQVKHGDLNDIQAAIVADEKWKDITREMIDAIERDRLLNGSVDDFFCRTIGNSFAVTANGTDLNITVGAGDAVWAETDGVDDYDIIHGAKATATVLAVNAGHATLPRWDMISVKIARGASGVGNTVTFSYTAGTANASPWLGEPGAGGPALPSGHVPLARIEVAATDTVLDQANVVDKRRPIGFSRSPGPILASSDWNLVPGWIYQSGAGAQVHRIPIVPPERGPGEVGDALRRCRLARIRLSIDLDIGTGTCKLRKRALNSNSVSDVFDFTSQITSATQAIYDLVIPETGTSTSGAVWANGERSPWLNQSNDALLWLEIVSGAASDEIRGCIPEWWG